MFKRIYFTFNKFSYMVYRREHKTSTCAKNLTQKIITLCRNSISLSKLKFYALESTTSECTHVLNEENIFN